nr:1,4-dihydroxy-2-naphthoate octaprenyltransferase [Blattabacterium cuenoti]
MKIMNKKLKYWCVSARLHTLLLSFSGITLSFLISKYKGYQVSFVTYFLCLMTALFLQVLSHFSNDYGDFVKGVDNCKRIGPLHPIQKGFISLLEMRKAVNVFSILSFFSGILLIFQSIKVNVNNFFILLFYFLGILICIYSSINYSMGKKPYGYIGMGDLFVLIFFGVVSVMGSYFLYTHTWHRDVFFYLYL